MSDLGEMNEAELRAFLADQRKAMEDHKWIESEKAGRDLGQACILDWIHNHAEGFRENYVKAKLAEQRAQKAEG